MKNIRFNKLQVVRIDNKEQYNEICHVLRNNRKLGEGYELPYDFPVYLEHAESAFSGISIGLTANPINTWTKKPYQVLSFEEAINNVPTLKT